MTCLIAVALLAGCGTKQSDRVGGGAAAGAATGAGVGALGGPPGMAVGALVGAGAGAATGAATRPSDVNLGKPPWSNPETRVPTPNGPVGPGSRRTSAAASGTTTTDQLNDQSYQASQQGSSMAR